MVTFSTFIKGLS